MHATLIICSQLEQRPGLKSLLQKLTGLFLDLEKSRIFTYKGLPTRANLWTLCVSATHALLQFEICLGERENIEDEARIGRILQLLKDFGGIIQEKTRIKVGCFKTVRNMYFHSIQGPSLDQPENNCSKSKDNAGQPSRANPFIRQQRSLDSNQSVGTKRAEVKMKI